MLEAMRSQLLRQCALNSCAKGMWSRGGKSAGASEPAHRQETLWRTGADGWQFPRLVGRSRAARVFDESGGRCSGEPPCAGWKNRKTIWAAVGVVMAWMGKYGGPQALDTDGKNVYAREAAAKEILHGMPSLGARVESALAQFGRMCEQLGIKIVAASSPRPKGGGTKSWHA